MIILELPVLFPTEEAIDNERLGIDKAIEVMNKSTMTTFYLPLITKIRINENELEKTKTNMSLDLEEGFYLIDADYSTTDSFIQQAIAKAERK
jgi:hypothetical protein